MAIENIPYEMRLYNQWVMWRYEDEVKVPYSPRTSWKASVSEPHTWASFNECVAALQTGLFSGIGFVLTESDPFAIIDLDDTKGDEVALDKQVSIYNEFNSYAERSPSGKGLHIIIKGAIPTGRRRKFVELYSSYRYMTITGDVFRNSPIIEMNDKLNALYNEMSKGNSAIAQYTGLSEVKETDVEVYNRAVAAANGGKFKDLFEGRWQDYYQSQSEADFALVDIIAFYTQNAAQITRLFRASDLGKREKAQRDDYVRYMLNKCFDRMLPPIDFDALRYQFEKMIACKTDFQNQAEKIQNDIVIKRETCQFEELYSCKSADVYTAPPGIIGQVARFIYDQAPRPVAEIALAGALGFVSGIVGRAYNISATGLNQYILLLAPTGTGKEAIARGTSKLMREVVKSVPAAMDFVGPGKINSEQALLKHFNSGKLSFYCIIGEFGIRIKEMSLQNASPHMANLLALLLDVFNKSGEGELLGGSIYSEKEKNTGLILSPAATLIGESSPEKFYENLDESMILSGMMPRLTTIEYNSIRVPLNENHASVKPSAELIEKVATICAHALMLNSQNKVIHVKQTPEAELFLKEFDKFCDIKVNASNNEVKRHLWSRAHIKALKLAALVAVGCNSYDPVVAEENARWAVCIVMADIRNIIKKFDIGEVGSNSEELQQLNRLAKCIREYLTQPWSEVSRYAEGMVLLHANKIVPYAYLQRKLSNIAVFRKDRMGSTVALKRAIKTLCERGDLQEISRAALAKDFNCTAVAYVVKNFKIFGL